jgi:multidrug efflux pump subunit AcrB
MSLFVTWVRPSPSRFSESTCWLPASSGSFRLPLVILIPVKLTLIGIVLRHWFMGAPFTATSMIGFIALAGIIVRNSILLVDFIRHRRAEGAVLRQALLEAGAIRFKPIFLTAVAAMIGAAFIMTDPIFQGLAISLVFGLASSTALTVLVIPSVYVGCGMITGKWARGDFARSAHRTSCACQEHTVNGWVTEND